MRVIFADTVYWVAITNPRDALHDQATKMPDELGEHRIVNSELVLVELLNILSGHGGYLRQSATGLVQRIIDNPYIELVPQTPHLFREALALYRERPDKAWSLTDCASFLIMDERRITEALTHDQHFVQNGYHALLGNP